MPICDAYARPRVAVRPTSRSRPIARIRARPHTPPSGGPLQWRVFALYTRPPHTLWPRLRVACADGLRPAQRHRAPPPPLRAWTHASAPLHTEAHRVDDTRRRRQCSLASSDPRPPTAAIALRARPSATGCSVGTAMHRERAIALGIGDGSALPQSHTALERCRHAPCKWRIGP